MPRRRTHTSGPRNRIIGVRVTDDEYAKLTAEASQAGVTIASLAYGRVLKKRSGEGQPAIVHHAMDPGLFAELRRIGNNLNQVAHAINGGLPPHVMNAYRAVHELVQTLTRDEMLAQRIATYQQAQTQANDSTPPPPRHEFQRRVHVRPSRSWRDE